MVLTMGGVLVPTKAASMVHESNLFLCTWLIKACSGLLQYCAPIFNLCCFLFSALPDYGVSHGKLVQKKENGTNPIPASSIAGFGTAGSNPSRRSAVPWLVLQIT